MWFERLMHAYRLLNELINGTLRVEAMDEFYVATLGYFRGTKLAYYGFFTHETMQLIRKLKKKTTYKTVKSVKRRFKKDIVTYKYLRKFAFDMMTSEELNIPESVADFIQGRVPKSVGARHYMKLKRKATQFYPRYAEYIIRLRQKALN